MKIISDKMNDFLDKINEICSNFNYQIYMGDDINEGIIIGNEKEKIELISINELGISFKFFYKDKDNKEQNSLWLK